MSKEEDTAVYSARINKEIKERFIEECKRLNIPHKYVISEYMKKFIVLNIDKDSHETAVLFEPSTKMDFLDDN